MDESPRSFLRYRPFVPAAVAFAAGILVREYLDTPRAVAWATAAALAAAFPLARRARMHALALAALYGLIFAAGWVRLDIASPPSPPHHLARFLDTQPKLVKLRGTVASDPQLQILPAMPLSGDSPWLAEKSSRTRFDLDASGVWADGDWQATCGRVRVVDHGASTALHYGDTVVVTGTAVLPRPPTNPGALDAATLLRRRGIAAVMSVSRGALIVEGHRRANALLKLVYAARARLRGFLSHALPPETSANSLLCALLLGDKTELDEDIAEKFKRTGTMHLLAISGLHVGIVAWFAWRLAALFGAGRRLSGTLALAVVLGYTLLTGAAPSAVRAAVMTGALVLSIVGRREPETLRAAALAFLVLLLIQPADLFHVGFQLSFAAVLGICCLSDGLFQLLRPRPSLLRHLMAPEDVSWARRAWEWLTARGAGALSISLAAWLGVFPLLAYYFNLLSPITVLVNLVAVPLVGILVGLGFVVMALSCGSTVMASFLGWPVRGFAWALIEIVRWVDRIPFAWAYCPAPAVGWVMGYYALGLIVVTRRRLGLNGKHAAMLWMAGLLVYLVAARPNSPPAGTELIVLDVQHGSSVVLRCRDGSTVVYDCGSYGRSDVGRWAAAPALWHWGVRRIDLLAVSHADADHVNGIPSLLERFRVGRVVYSPVLERAEAGRQLLAMLDQRRIPHQAVKTGDRVEVGSGTVLDVVSPIPWTLRACPENQNENSLVLSVPFEGRRILLAGDAQTMATTALAHSGADLRADVLVVPHHGCLLPSSAAFADAVKPQWAICSNRADHLPAATVATYEQAGAKVLATCWDGAVTVRIQGGKLEVVPFHPRAGEVP